MGLLKQNSQLAHCLSCGATIDIFDAAAILEHLPESGPEWFKSSLLYLANKFGLDVPKTNFSAEEINESEIFRAYSHAAQIIKHPTKISNIVASKLIEYGWGREVISKLSIGAVENYKFYIDKMVNFYKHTPEFLAKYDLDNKQIFNENNIIYTIKDEHGSPVGFAARNLEFEAQKVKYESDPNTYKPSKYYNTSNKSLIYNKSKTLYLFNEAKKESKALLIMEGQADAVTAYAGGITSVCSICSTAFTKEHLDMIYAAGIRHIIFVLDPDEAGQNATHKFITLSENCREEYSDLRVEAIVLPGKDPDEFIRSFGNLQKGAQELRKQPRIDSFVWQLTKALEFGVDPISLATRMMPRILDQPNNLLRQKMCDQLSEITNLDKNFMRQELLKQIDIRTWRTNEQKSAIIKEIAQSLEKVSKQLTFLFPEE